MQFSLAIILLVTALTAFCQSPCSSPPKWEAHVSAHDYVSRASANATVSYDAVNKRQRVVETVWLNGNNFTYDVLYLDSIKTIYRYDFQVNKCVKQEVKESWVDLGVPSSAKLVKKQMIGSEDVKEANMLTNLWQYELQDKIGNKIVSFETWSAVGCLPVDFVHFSKSAGINIVKRFFDIKLGIVDQSVWKVRDECVNL